VVTVFGGGYIASGPADGSRLPTPVWPPGLSLIGAEGAGEVQTPLRGAAAADLAVGDRVWFRHAKAGELCERFEALLLVPGDAEKAGDWQAVPTYRGEGRTFG
jgi:D-serine deaminase-like pyridoxal phosphate-dependent protein